MKMPPSFRRFLLMMVFLLEALSLTIVIGFMFVMLDRSMKQELVSRTNAQQMELRLHLTNRFKYTYSRMEEIRDNNNIKIGLLIGMHSKIAESMYRIYPETSGSSFYVRDVHGRYFPQLPDERRLSINDRLFSPQPEDIAQSSINPHTFAYVAPIVQQNRIIGYAMGIYDLRADQNCRKLLKTYDGLHLAYRQGRQLTNLLTQDPVAAALAASAEEFSPAYYPSILTEDGTASIGHKELASLFLIPDDSQYLHRRHIMVTKLIYLCILLCVLTFSFSFVILKRVTSTLDGLARNAIHVADSDEHVSLDTVNIRHVEFLNLARAFNKVLGKMRLRTDDLKEANENLQKQSEKRRQMARALQESESQLRSLQDNIPVGLFRRTVDGRLLFANPKMVSIFGYESEKKMLEVPIQQLYHYPEQYAHIMGKFAASDNIQGLELLLKRKDGSPIWGAIHLKKTHDPKTEETFIDGAILDITDRKQIEDENHKLETQLRQAHKMEALGTLAGGIAHDFNNILFAMTGFCELAIEDAAPDSRQRKNLLDAIACVQRAADLVRQILTFARQTDVQKDPLNLSPILKESLKLLRATLPATIDIRTQITNGLTVLADPTQVHQVVVNLCTNAGHAMRDTGGTLTIELDQIDGVPDDDCLGEKRKAGPYARLKVSDSGHGIPVENMERIFDPYFTTKAQGEGNGMGLSVVQGIVSSLGGIISVDSEPGKGTTFNVYLPAMVETDTVEKEQGSKSIVNGREHILFVDDEEQITSMISQMLSRLGYHVTAFTSAQKALDEFSRSPEQFDLVISDVTMPNMAGHELAQEIRKIRPDLPILLCTGYSENINEEIAMSAGARDLLFKPLNRHELSTSIRSVLDYRPDMSGSLPSMTL
jgi:PAS domain S-box-containing protein